VSFLHTFGFEWAWSPQIGTLVNSLSPECLLWAWQPGQVAFRGYPAVAPIRLAIPLPQVW
jgi:hypothetical protein